ncbi:MAG: hypothetical protein AB7T22_16650 [Calditrichaceae bacterium]
MMMGILGIAGGAAVGYLVGHNMSKLNLGCPLICNPRISTIYFAVMGFLLATGY